MSNRIRLPSLVVQRQLVGGRQFSASYVSTSRTGSTIRRSPSKERAPQNHVSATVESQDHPIGPVIPDTPGPPHFPLPNKKMSGKRPAVSPSPTLALPQSMHPPSPRPPLPILPRRPTRSAGGTTNPPAKAYDIYMKSLDTINTEPTLEDLDALRPSPSTLRAAWDGVIGSGRSLLPDGHALHLAIEQLGAPEASVGGGPGAKKKVVAGSPKAKKMEYTALYEATEGHVARGFNLSQLKRLERESRHQLPLEKQEFPPEKSSSKAKIIHRIMHSRWKMIHPLVIKEILATENEVKEQVYPVSPSELFIFLGKDGENLLHLAKELRMSIAVDRASQATDDSKQSSPSTDPKSRSNFIIRASGVKASHKRLKKHLEEQRSLMAIRVVTLPTGPLLSPTVLHNVSRISGAFVENMPTEFTELKEGENSVLITARNARSAYTAERLVHREAMGAAHRSQIPLFCLTPPDESLPNILDTTPLEAFDDEARYALYPFDAHGLRIRHVQHGALYQRDPVSNEEQLILTGEIPQSSSEEMVITNLKGEIVELRRYMLGQGMEPPVDGTTKLIATYGHIVFKAPSQSTLGLPLTEPVSRNSILEWVANEDSHSRRFIPGQVPSITPSNSNAMLSLHRLQYRTVDGGHIVNVNVQLPNDDQSATAKVPPEEFTGSTSSADRLELTPGGYLEGPGGPAEDGQVGPTREADIPSSLGDEQTANPRESAEPVEAAGEPKQKLTLLPTEIEVGTETALEVMLPDSTMDIYLQSSNTSPLEGSEVPENLTTYLKELATFFNTDADIPQPDPPQQLSVKGRDYMLTKNTSSRYVKDPNAANLPPGCAIATEVSLDLENNSKTVFTELIHDGKGEEASWEGFMRTCRRLACKPYERSNELRANPT